MKGDSQWLGKDVFGTSGDTISFTQDGTHAEYVAVPNASLVRKPNNLSFAQASCIGVPFTTAMIMMNRANLTSMDTVLIIGANGAVGSAASQLARLKMPRVLTASRHPDSDINTSEDPDLSAAKSINDGKGPDVIIDTVGSDQLAKAALAILSLRGRYAYISTGLSNGMLTLDMKNVYRKEQMIIGCNSLIYTPAESAMYLSSLVARFERAEIVALSDDELIKVPIEQALEAYEKVGARCKGKYVIVFD